MSAGEDLLLCSKGEEMQNRKFKKQEDKRTVEINGDAFLPQ